MHPDLERDMDAVLADSFPASDPPSWTPAIAETRPPAPALVERPPRDVKYAGLVLPLSSP